MAENFGHFIVNALISKEYPKAIIKFLNSISETGNFRSAVNWFNRGEKGVFSIKLGDFTCRETLAYETTKASYFAGIFDLTLIGFVVKFYTEEEIKSSLETLKSINLIKEYIIEDDAITFLCFGSPATCLTIGLLRDYDNFTLDELMKSLDQNPEYFTFISALKNDSNLSPGLIWMVKNFLQLKDTDGLSVSEYWNKYLGNRGYDSIRMYLEFIREKFKFHSFYICYYTFLAGYPKDILDNIKKINSLI